MKNLRKWVTYFANFIAVIVAIPILLFAWVRLDLPPRLYTPTGHLETGSTEWWNAMNTIEETHLKNLRKYPVDSLEYRRALEVLDASYKEKHLVSRMIGLNKESKKYSDLDNEYKKVVEEHHRKMAGYSTKK